MTFLGCCIISASFMVFVGLCIVADAIRFHARQSSN